MTLDTGTGATGTLSGASEEQERADVEATAWVGKCDGCGLYCVLYEQVEFVCGRCHGEINPGNAISAPVDQALTTLFEHKLPTDDILRVLWLANGQGQEGDHAST